MDIPAAAGWHQLSVAHDLHYIMLVRLKAWVIEDREAFDSDRFT